MTETTALSPIQVEPWPSEKPLTVIVAIFSAMMWLLLLFTIFGFFYAMLFAIIFFFVPTTSIVP